MPCYNELATTVDESVKRGARVPLGSRAHHRRRRLHRRHRRSSSTLTATSGSGSFHQPRTTARARRLRRGFREATSEFVIIQDADLEYDPRDYEQTAGSAPRRPRRRRVRVTVHSATAPRRPLLLALGRQPVPHAGSPTSSPTSTSPTWRPATRPFRREVLEGDRRSRNRFGVEPEITAKVARGGWRVYEVGISYAGARTTRARRSAGATACGRYYCILRYSPIGERLRHSIARAGELRTRPARRRRRCRDRCHRAHARSVSVRSLHRGRYPVGDNGYFALRARDVFTDHHPLLGTWTSASLSVGGKPRRPGPAPVRHLRSPRLG